MSVLPIDSRSANVRQPRSMQFSGKLALIQQTWGWQVRIWRVERQQEDIITWMRRSSGLDNHKRVPYHFDMTRS